MKGIKLGKLIWGLAITLLGIILLGNTLGLARFGMWEGFSILWPLGLVAAGIAIILRMKVAASVIFTLTIVFALMHLLTSIGIVHGESRFVKLEAPFEGDVKTGTVNLKYGAGKLSIDEGRSDSFLSADVQTSDKNNPSLDVTRTSDEVEINLERSNPQGIRLNSGEESWDLHLTNRIPLNLNIDYGAADALFDLRDLRIAKLDINGGVTDAKVIFGEYPTLAEFDIGVTAMNLSFPNTAGVIIKVDGGILDVNFERFYQNNDMYFSKDYDKKKYIIELDIDAGVTDLNAQFYEPGDEI